MHHASLLLLLLSSQVMESRLRHRSHLAQCASCSPGWGVVTPCSTRADTHCAPCSPGSYSPHHSYHAPCWPCSRCGQGLYEAHPCNPTTDTVCDSCQRLQLLNTSKHCL